jgi:hypothetical protein
MACMANNKPNHKWLLVVRILINLIFKLNKQIAKTKADVAIQIPSDVW